MKNTSLDRLVDIGTEKLYRVKTVFPFTFFPDELVIDRTQVDVVYWMFFFNKRVFPIQVKDILNVVITTNLFFASLTFEIRGFEQNPKTISYLPKDKAHYAQQLIMGLIACYKQGVDYTDLSKEEILQKVSAIGGKPEIKL